MNVFQVWPGGRGSLRRILETVRSEISIVVLANPNLIDKLRVAVYPSIPFQAPTVGSPGCVFASFRRRAALQLEILALRHQLGVLL
jgi:hypothetical protein